MESMLSVRVGTANPDEMEDVGEWEVGIANR